MGVARPLRPTCARTQPQRENSAAANAASRPILGEYVAGLSVGQRHKLLRRNGSPRGGSGDGEIVALQLEVEVIHRSTQVRMGFGVPLSEPL